MSNLNASSKAEVEKLIKKRLEDASKDPFVFVDRFLYTFDPRRPPYHHEFHPFEYQKAYIEELKTAIEQGYDIFVDKARDMGVTYTTLAVFLWFWRYVPGSNFLLGSRKEDYVDNRGGSKSGEVSNKEESLFGKIDYMLRRCSPIVLPEGFNVDRHCTYMSLRNPENGNVISGESSNANFSRSGRFKAILLDEFAFWDNDSEAWGSTADTSPCRVVVTTPGIKPGKAKRLRFGKDGEKIKVIEFDDSLDPRKTAEWHQRERERRSAEDYAREIKRNWDTSIKGRVYDEIQYAVVGKFPYMPGKGIYVSWDFGYDGTAIQWWQFNSDNGKFRLLDCFFYSDKPVHYSFPLFGFPIDSEYDYSTDDLEAIQVISQLPKAVHYGDPDVSKRSYANKSASSTRKELRDKGIYVQTKPDANDFFTRREKTKVMMQKGIEVNETKRTDYWMESIKNARYPQRPDNSQSTSEISLPIHDWTSHHRTATEYFAVNFSTNNEIKSEQSILNELPRENYFNDEGFY